MLDLIGPWDKVVCYGAFHFPSLNAGSDLPAIIGISLQSVDAEKEYCRLIHGPKSEIKITASVNATTRVKSNGYHSQHVDPCRSLQMSFSQIHNRPVMKIKC
jgi:hypothetical protein